MSSKDKKSDNITLFKKMLNNKKKKTEGQRQRDIYIALAKMNEGKKDG